MIRLLNIEFFKLRHNKASRVLTLIYFGLLTSIALISSMKINLGFVSFKLAEQGIFNFPYIWHFNTFIAAGFKFFLLLLIVSMVSNEYSNKTLKQNLIDGLSKQEYILSKFYMVAAMSAVSTLFVFLVSLVLGLINSSEISMVLIFTDLEYFFGFFVKLLSFFSFGLFLGILIKRSAFALGALFIWYIIESIIHISIGSKSTAELIFSSLPLQSGSKLISEPFTSLKAIESLSSQMGGVIEHSSGVPIYNVIVSLVWTVIFIFGAYLIVKKRDL